MFLSTLRRVWLYSVPIDMRRGLNSLVVLVADQLGLSPGSGDLYIFWGKSKKHVKILYWERNGFCLWLKRLEGREYFQFTAHAQEGGRACLELSPMQLQWLLAGLKLEDWKEPEVLRYDLFY